MAVVVAVTGTFDVLLQCPDLVIQNGFNLLPGDGVEIFE